MKRFQQNSTSAMMAIVIVAATWLPVISAPLAEASLLTSKPILA